MISKRHKFDCAVLGLLLVGCAGCQTASMAFTAAAPAAQTDPATDKRTQDLYLSVIEQLVQYEKYHAALAHLDEFERLFGASPQTHALRGDAWLALGDLKAAETQYDAIAQGPLAGAGQNGLGNVAAARKDWPQAVVYFEDAVKAQPTNIRFLRDLSQAYSETGRAADADFALKKAQELSPLASATDAQK